MEADIASQAVNLGANTDFSLMSLFLRADIIVKSVMIILIVFSIYSWAVIIEKIRLFKKINKSSEEFEEKFWNSKSAETFYNSLPAKVDDPMAVVFQDAMERYLHHASPQRSTEKKGPLNRRPAKVAIWHHKALSIGALRYQGASRQSAPNCSLQKL